MGSASQIYAQLAALEKEEATLAALAERHSTHLIQSLSLVQPITLAAAVKIVCESGFTNVEEVARIAPAFLLTRRRVRRCH
jgi:hypothetical protein